MNRKEKRKPKYGFFSCVWYSLKLTRRANLGIMLMVIMTIPISLILNVIGLYMPTAILRELETNDSFLSIVSVILALLAAQLFFSLAKQYADIKSNNLGMLLNRRMGYGIYEKTFNMDYFLKLEKDTNQLLNRAHYSCRSNGTAGVTFLREFTNIVIDILSFVLFGSLVVGLHPLLVVLLTAGCIINYLMTNWHNKRNFKTKDDRSLTTKKINYIAYDVALDLKYGKDIRMFGLSDFFDTLISLLLKEQEKHQAAMERNTLVAAFVSFVVTLVRDGCAYALLIMRVSQGELDAAGFVLYFSAISRLSNFVSGIINTYGKVVEGALEVSDYREFLEVENRLNHGNGIAVPHNGPLSIEFKNVSFTYPEAERKILDNVSFKINAGEKIALVGINGAGKTTLTMLMCGLLIPDEGEVLIDGHSIYEYNCDYLYSLISIIPQEYSLLPMTIAENIALVDVEAGEVIDMDRLDYCLKLSGLKEKTDALPLGIHTPLNRQISTEAVDLSGGEIQKLLLARAIYRSARILILDEPTAALDPIAEDRIYRKYNDIVASLATSIFISHRLASTRFCDRIFLLDGAVVRENGTHDELMAQNGEYRRLFDIQAKYYREGVNDEEQT